MFDKKYWREQFPLYVQGYGGVVSVRVRTQYEDYLLRRVAKTEDGYGIFEMYLDASGEAPLISSTSDTYDFDTTMIVSSKSVHLTYEAITDVNIKLARDPRAIVH
jgi:hypothetical protein